MASISSSVTIVCGIPMKQKLKKENEQIKKLKKNSLIIVIQGTDVTCSSCLVTSIKRVNNESFYFFISF